MEGRLVSLKDTVTAFEEILAGKVSHNGRFHIWTVTNTYTARQPLGELVLHGRWHRGRRRQAREVAQGDGLKHLLRSQTWATVLRAS